MIVIPISSYIYRELGRLANERRLVFMTGLPGVGKSLLIQQLALIAQAAGRRVHILRYNDARQPFETTEILSRYPEIEGVTDPMIRKGVGLWARGAISTWHQAHSGPENLLIGELPLIGNRLIELAETMDDEAESLLAGRQAEFVIPIPSWEVREVIEKTRAQTLASPRHELEKLDAPPNVLRALWEEVNHLARETGLTKARPDSPYNPYIYGGVYQLLLRHRHSLPLLIEEVLRPNRSVYDLEIGVTRLKPSPVEAQEALKKVENQFSWDELQMGIENWSSGILASAPAPDLGPELRLPRPDGLPGVVQRTALSQPEIIAIENILKLPLDCPGETLNSTLKFTLSLLEQQMEAANVTTGIHKFDVYDSYFNVSRFEKDDGRVFLTGLIQAFLRLEINLPSTPNPLSVIERPLLRMALETALRQFL